MFCSGRFHEPKISCPPSLLCGGAVFPYSFFCVVLLSFSLPDFVSCVFLRISCLNCTENNHKTRATSCLVGPIRGGRAVQLVFLGGALWRPLCSWMVLLSRSNPVLWVVVFLSPSPFPGGTAWPPPFLVLFCVFLLFLWID